MARVAKALSMTIRFAPAARFSRNSIARTVRSGVPMAAANDNGPRATDPEVFHATLRHFAEHGLSAPRKAAEFARQAAKRGDRVHSRHWVVICKALDHRLGRILERQLDDAELRSRV